MTNHWIVSVRCCDITVHLSDKKICCFKQNQCFNNIKLNMLLLASSSLFCITTEVYGHFSIWSCSSHELHGGKKHNISHIILQSCCWVFFMWRGTEMGKQEHLFVDATVNQIWPNHTHTVVQEAAQWSFICSLFVSTWILFQDYLVVKNEYYIYIL